MCLLDQNYMITCVACRFFCHRRETVMVPCKHVPLSMVPIINKIGRVCGFVGCMGEFVWTNRIGTEIVTGGIFWDQYD